MYSYFDRKRKLSSTKTSMASLSPLPLSQGTIQRSQSNPQQLTPDDVRSLQSTIGNQHVQRLLSVKAQSGAPAIQRVDEDKSEESESLHLDDKELELGEGETPGFELTDEGRESDSLHLDEKELALSEGESPGFELLGEESEEAKSETPSHTSHEYRYQSPYRRGHSAPTQPAKKTLGEKFTRFKRSMKQFAKNQTVHTYGKNGIHALMRRDEKTISKAAKLVDKNPDQARKLLRNVYAVTKQGVRDLPSVGSGIRLALMSPVWFARWQVAHARWKSLAKQVGLIAPKPVKDETPVEQPEQKVEEQHEWQRANPEQKDWFGGLNAWMMGGDSAKSRGMSMQERQHAQQKWRARELANPSILAGKQRHQGWMNAYSRDGNQRDSTEGIKLGKQRPEWKSGETWHLGAKSGVGIGGHRPVWGFDKPTSKQSSSKLGKHRPVWDYRGDPTGESDVKLGGHRPVWGLDKPGGEKSGFKMGRHRPVWDYRGGGGGESGVALGEHRKPTIWENAQPEILYPPNSVPELGSHRKDEEKGTW